MAAVPFVGNDEAYQTWLHQNPDGYVINTHPNQPSQYRVLHKASCWTISRYVGQAKRKGAYTERLYAKVCATRLRDLDEWAKKNGGFPYHPCGICTPL